MITGVSAIPSIAASQIRPIQVESTDQAEPFLFADVVKSVVQQSASLEKKASDSVVGLLSGTGVEVHEAMIATQQSELAFELALQLRNKAISAYQQMMQMQF